MIEFTRGDMFSVTVDARVNTVNCQGVMGAGVALAFKSRYPEMFKDYQAACRDGSVRPGRLHVWKNLAGDWVINFPTKRDWRAPSRYEDIYAGLQALRSYLRAQGAISVALPALGCGHGGLEWSKVAPMIKDMLGDLDARILVFEPADSRKAGILRQQITEDQWRKLTQLSFHSSELPDWVADAGLASTGLSRGDDGLLRAKWLGLLPSRDPIDREMSALNAIASQMSRSSHPATVAVLYTGHVTENVISSFISYRVPLVVILPFGPLSRKSAPQLLTGGEQSSTTLLSLAGPEEKWSPQLFARSMKLLSSGSFGILISDPMPDWVKDKTVRTWSERPFFYLRYDKSHNSVHTMLDKMGGKPIGRKSDSGEPNLIPLFKSSSADDNTGETVSTGQLEFDLPLSKGSAAMLRVLAEAIECYGEKIGEARFTIPRRSETEALCAEFTRVLDSLDHVRSKGSLRKRHSRSNT